MYFDGAMNLTPAAGTSSLPLDRHIAEQAAKWFILLTSGEASSKEQHAFEAWRIANAEHERAWQRAQQVSKMAGLVPATVGKAVLCRPVSSKLKRRQAIQALVVLMTGVPSGWLVYKSTPWRAWSSDYSTAIGEQRAILLPDGTQIHLNTATAVDIAYDEQHRSLLLRAGEIMVTSAPDPITATGKAARPFLLITEHGSVRPIGTRFIVRQQSSESHVAVLEGAVELRPKDSKVTQLLGVGRAASFDAAQIISEQALPVGSGLWTSGIFAAEDMRLDQLLSELGRYRSGFLACDPALADLRITGAFQLNNIDGALNNIAQLLSVDIRYRTRFWVTLVPTKEMS